MINDELDKYYSEITKLGNKRGEFVKYFNQIINGGKRTYYEKNIIEEKKFDKEWIEALESYLPSIDKITKNPKSTLAYTSEVVEVSKARNTNASSIRHLASHTQFIKQIDERGSVIPSKVLTSFSEDNFKTYENRFIMTLVQRLYTFVDKRYKVIRDNVESFQRHHMNYQAEFDINNTKVSFNIDLSVTRDLDNAKVNKDNHELLKRVETLLDLVKGMKASPFMSLLDKAKKVQAPIMKTNVILKNPDFRNAYTLWLFLDRYSTLGYDLKVKEKNIPLSKEFEHDLKNVAMYSYSSFLANTTNRREHFENLDDYQEIVKKSTKIAKTNIQDVINDPDEIIIENVSIYEYYLEQYKKMFNKRYKEYLNAVDRSDLALKKALRETIDISNYLYEGIFNFEKEVDYFKRLVTESNPEDDLKEAKEKARLCKIIREVKEKDYQSYLKLERRLMSDIDQANRKILEDKKNKYRASTVDTERAKLNKEIAKITKTRDTNKEYVGKLDSKNQGISTTKDSLKEELVKINSEIKTKTKEYMQAEKAKIKEEIKEMKKNHKAKLKEISLKKQEEAKKRKEQKETIKKLKKEETKKAMDEAKAKISTLRKQEIDKQKSLEKEEINNLKNQ